MTQVITEYNELKNILKTPFLQDKFDKTNELEFLDLDELEEKFITDKHSFNNIMNELPIWFDETNNIGFVPIPGIFDIEFFLLQKQVKKYKLIKNLNNECFTWNVVANPLYKFCREFKLSTPPIDKKINVIAGPPAQVIMVGSDLCLRRLKKNINLYPYITQKYILEKTKVNLAINIKSLYEFNPEDYDINEKRNPLFASIHALWVIIQNINTLHNSQWNFSQGCKYITRTIHVEETVLDIVQSDDKLQKLFLNTYKEDYNFFNISNEELFEQSWIDWHLNLEKHHLLCQIRTDEKKLQSYNPGDFGANWKSNFDSYGWHKKCIDNKSQLENLVDKFIICIAGQPRNISTKSWRHFFPNQLQKTIEKTIDDRFPFQGYKEHKPEIHIICSVWEKDCIDKYFTEDVTKGGMTDKRVKLPFYKLENNTKVGLRSLKKDKFKQYCDNVFNWADSVRYTLIDPYDPSNKWRKTDVGASLDVSPTWLGQWFLFIDSINDHWDLFKDSGRNTVVLRTRWDMVFPEDMTLWHFAYNLFRFMPVAFSEKNTSKHNTHHDHGDLSPIVLSHDINIFKGFVYNADYWHCFDGPGAKILGKNFYEWFNKNYKNILPIKEFIFDPEKPLNRETNFISGPHASINKFFYENFFTMYCNKDHPQSINCNQNLSAFTFFMQDQWRLEWYDWDIHEVYNNIV